MASSYAGTAETGIATERIGLVGAHGRLAVPEVSRYVLG